MPLFCLWPGQLPGRCPGLTTRPCLPSAPAPEAAGDSGSKQPRLGPVQLISAAPQAQSLQEAWPSGFAPQPLWAAQAAALGCQTHPEDTAPEAVPGAGTSRQAAQCPGACSPWAFLGLGPIYRKGERKLGKRLPACLGLQRPWPRAVFLDKELSASRPLQSQPLHPAPSLPPPGVVESPLRAYLGWVCLSGCCKPVFPAGRILLEQSWESGVISQEAAHARPAPLWLRPRRDNPLGPGALAPSLLPPHAACSQDTHAQKQLPQPKCRAALSPYRPGWKQGRRPSQRGAGAVHRADSTRQDRAQR